MSQIIMKSKGQKIKRRNFFKYIAAAGVGLYVLAKKPFETAKRKFTGAFPVEVKENPLAVKRNNIING